MILVFASGAAVLLSILASAIAGVGLSLALGMPMIVSFPLLAVAYVALWIIIPLCLVVCIICTAPTQRDLPLHIAAVALAGLIWLVWGALLPPKRGGEQVLWAISFASAIAPVPVHWAVFLFAQRKRRTAATARPPIET